jgi:eukaryotic-like serine/threonine-protein kinase
MYTPSIQELEKRFPQIFELEHLDSGGQKVVFAGHHQEHGDVVLKLTDKVDDRTRREIDIVTNNRLPGVPVLFEWGNESFDDGEVMFLIEERVRGRSLRSVLQQVGTLDFPQASELLGFLLRSAAIFESERLVHRDIKPENIMIADDGTFFILDFGIARALDQTSLTATAARFGPATFGYAAPEQFRNMKKEIDARADLFSIGIVFYECITGVNPFIEGARSRLDVIKRSEKQPVQKLEIEEDSSGELAAFIDTLMQKWPSRRPRTAAEAWSWFQEIISREGA